MFISKFDESVMNYNFLHVINVRGKIHLGLFTRLKVIYLKLQQNIALRAIINQIICFVSYSWFQRVYTTKIFRHSLSFKFK